MRYVPHGDQDEQKQFAAIIAALAEDPPQSAIRRKQGFDYLHGYYVFAKANEIFGPLNVEYVHKASSVLHTGTVVTTDRDGVEHELEYVVVESSASVRISLPGDRIIETDGTATNDGMGRGYGKAYEIAHKGAFTDARKIALRPLGAAFGAKFSLNEGEGGDEDDDGRQSNQRKPQERQRQPSGQRKRTGDIEPRDIYRAMEEAGATFDDVFQVAGVKPFNIKNEKDQGVLAHLYDKLMDVAASNVDQHPDPTTPYDDVEDARTRNATASSGDDMPPAYRKLADALKAAKIHADEFVEFAAQHDRANDGAERYLDLDADWIEAAAEHVSDIVKAFGEWVTKRDEGV